MKIIIALALLGRGAQAQINTLKYTQVGVGACRGNGGPADKVSGVYKTTDPRRRRRGAATSSPRTL